MFGVTVSDVREMVDSLQGIVGRRVVYSVDKSGLPNGDGVQERAGVVMHSAYDVDEANFYLLVRVEDGNGVHSLDVVSAHRVCAVGRGGGL